MTSGSGGRNGGRMGGGARTLSIFPGAAANRDVPEGATMSPVTATGLAEMARLRKVIVVVVAKLSVGGVTAWTRYLFLFWWWGSRVKGLG